MLTPDDVTAAYQLILGRKPESEDMIRQQIADAKTFEGLRDIILTSDEFIERVKSDLSLRATLYPALSTMAAFQNSEQQVRASRDRGGPSTLRGGRS